MTDLNPVVGDINRSHLPVVILSTADADAPIWTNKQHIASRLSASREVYYIESMGLRRPRLALKDLARLLDAVKTLILRSGYRPTLGSAHVISPKVLPFHGSLLAQKVNSFLVRKMIVKKLPCEYILWSFSPITYSLQGSARSFVYHSVDLLHELPRVPRRALLDAERSIVSSVSSTVASSAGVRDHLVAQGFSNVRLWENVADLKQFYDARTASDGTREWDAIFAGNLTPSKIDYQYLQALVDRGLRLALAGPTEVDGAGGADAVRKLLSHHLVTYLGVLNQRALAEAFARSGVGLIPYRLNSYTSGVFPMKVYEYLAAGLQVVSTPLANLQRRAIDGLHIESEIGKFALKVEVLLEVANADPVVDVSHSWEYRIDQILRLIDEQSPVGADDVMDGL